MMKKLYYTITVYIEGNNEDGFDAPTYKSIYVYEIKNNENKYLIDFELDYYDNTEKCIREWLDNTGYDNIELIKL